MDLHAVMSFIIGLGGGVAVLSVVWGFYSAEHQADEFSDGFTAGMTIAGLGAVITATLALYLK